MRPRLGAPKKETQRGPHSRAILAAPTRHPLTLINR